jgi:hypothetical protein
VLPHLVDAAIAEGMDLSQLSFAVGKEDGALGWCQFADAAGRRAAVAGAFTAAALKGAFLVVVHGHFSFLFVPSVERGDALLAAGAPPFPVAESRNRAESTFWRFRNGKPF